MVIPKTVSKKTVPVIVKPKRVPVPELAHLQGPPCPRCKGKTVKRSGARGEFWGCANYPRCQAMIDIQTGKIVMGPEPAEPIKKMAGSPEQERVWREMLTQRSHLVIKARAGTGKTWTMVQACLRIRHQRIVFTAFNKHIAVEAQGKLRASGCTNVTCSTYHSLGYKALRDAYPNTVVDDDKVRTIIEGYYPKPAMGLLHDWYAVVNLTKKLTELAKNYLLDWKASDFRSRLELLADHHALDMTGSESKNPLTIVPGPIAIGMVPRVLDKCLKTIDQSICYDDMIWAPVMLRLSFERCDILIVDEFQDSNACQQELCFRIAGDGRIVVIGDDRQAIYGFRGADISAIPTMIGRLEQTKRNVKVLPLTITRRCPKLHVKLAQSIVPDIQAVDDAPEGIIDHQTEDVALGMMKPGDLVLSRVNKVLIPAAYSLLRRGIRAVIKGRDIGEGLTALVEKLEKDLPAGVAALPALVSALQNYRAIEIAKLEPLGPKGEGRMAALTEKCDCLSEMISHVRTIPELKQHIEDLFSDFDQAGKPQAAVILGTVHRTKGLESERVFVLAPELIPHPRARKEWEVEQEVNLAYVAVTRAKYRDAKNPGTLVFCGPLPMIYAGLPKEPGVATPSNIDDEGFEDLEDF